MTTRSVPDSNVFTQQSLVCSHSYIYHVAFTFAQRHITMDATQKLVTGIQITRTEVTIDVDQ